MNIRWLKGFAAFWYDFIVGDDWRVAAGVVLAMAATYGAAHILRTTSWWVLPVALMIILPLSLRRHVRDRR